MYAGVHRRNVCRCVRCAEAHLQCDDETDGNEVVVEDDECEDGQEELSSLSTCTCRSTIWQVGHNRAHKTHTHTHTHTHTITCTYEQWSITHTYSVHVTGHVGVLGATYTCLQEYMQIQ